MTALPIAFIIAFAASAVIGHMQLIARDRAGVWTVSAALLALAGVIATKGMFYV